MLVISTSMAFAQVWEPTDLWLPESVLEIPTASWFGTTGMTVIPTAHVLDHTDVSVHGHYIDFSGTDDWEGVFGANVCIYPGLEVGATVWESGLTGTGSDETTLDIKYSLDTPNLLDLGPDAPLIAIGARDISNEVNRGYYIVLSQDFTMDVERGQTVSATLGFGDSDISGSALDGFFAGIDFSPFDFARIQVEHDSDNLNAQLRYWWSEWAVTEVGFLDGDFGAGVSIYTGF